MDNNFTCTLCRALVVASAQCFCGGALTDAFKHELTSLGWIICIN